MTSPEVTSAKSMCTECPVRRECLSEGMTDGWGVWGGFTSPERRRALERLEGDPEAVLRAFDLGVLDTLTTPEPPVELRLS